jgi:hypothetical protein
VGVDGRPGDIAKAMFVKEALGLDDVDFVCDDVRNVSASRYGEFDAIICSGILYHLDSPNVFILIERMLDMVRNRVVIDTHVSLDSHTSVRYKGKTYHGANVKEPHAGYLGDHPVELAPEQFRPEFTWASLHNPTSFHLSRPSLVNALQQAGFSSVYECFNPPHLNFGSLDWSMQIGALSWH